MIDLLDVVLVKYTGLSGRATEVNSISYKTVDSATYLDSIDSINYAVRAPYGTRPKNLSYENWIKFKLRLNRKYRKCLKGTSMQLPCFEVGCDDMQVYTKIKNVKLWLKFQCFVDYEIKYAFAKEYTTPIRTDSVIAINNIRAIQNPKYNEEYVVEIPIGNQDGEMLLGELDQYESDFFVSQLIAYKGCQFQNSIMKVCIHYDLA